MRGAFTGYIKSIGVREDQRSRGLGAQLMKAAESRILQESPNVFICVSSFNPRAQAFYGRLGYEVVGTLRDFIVRGHDEILLRKTTGPLTGFSPR
jgi:ribosomal protein S18 acetylase RimI-like enzyme